ncbi:hypothetical protein ACFYZJ_01660 [Streptomyces sp. NPDC001848]|uniref:hypothetical protein n=1 Tax=Streptomyces sp. NPDC001848 TaxID=3364618 RepID=UPI0036AC9A67
MQRPHVSDPLSPPIPAPSPHPFPHTSLLPEPPGRLPLPEGLTAALGYDAVGIPKGHGERIMNCLPRVGCVFADDLRWWWIVPAGSDTGVTWPPTTSYAVDARLVPGAVAHARRDPSWSGPRPGRPRLIHRPDGDSPYTPPIPLYFLACRLVGSTPHWSPGVGA